MCTYVYNLSIYIKTRTCFIPSAARRVLSWFSNSCPWCWVFEAEVWKYHKVGSALQLDRATTHVPVLPLAEVYGFEYIQNFTTIPPTYFEHFCLPTPNEPICLLSCSFLSLSSWFWSFENSAQDSPGCPGTLQVALAGLKFATVHFLSLPSTGVSGVSHLAWHAHLLFLGTLMCQGLLRSCFPSVWVSRHDLFTCSPPQFAFSCAHSLHS